MAFTVATFNVQNLISPGRPFQGGPGWSAADFDWKIEWLSDQILALDADILALQEVFDADALATLVARTDEKGRALAAGGYGGTLWRGGAWRPYGAGGLAHVVNENGTATSPRPGMAIVSRHPIGGTGHVQELGERAIAVDFMQLGAGRAGEWTLSRLSRPVQWARIAVEGQILTLFNAHLKSPAPEFPDGGWRAPEWDLSAYDPVGRGVGQIRANLRRMGEALALRREVVAALDRGEPVVVAGDMNAWHDGDAAQILTGERAAEDYTTEERFGGEGTWSAAESAAIRARIEGLRLDSAERVAVARAGGKASFRTTAWRGLHESLDRLLLSVHFRDGDARQIGRLEHLRVQNDHLNDGGLAPAAFDALASDHGALVARFAWL